MSRARSINKEPRQTAAASENGSGCSVYWIPPLAALFIVCLLTIFAWNQTIHTSALPINTPTPQATGLSLPISTPQAAIVDNNILVVPTVALSMDVVNGQTEHSTTSMDRDRKSTRLNS